MAKIYIPRKKWKRQDGDAKRKERQRIYDTARWRSLRAAYLMEHPLCERCKENGRIKSAEDVHHRRTFVGIADFSEQKAVAYDYENLMAVCRQCHNELHKLNN
jgi:5-methylcytosine-specific restriction protein A